MYISFPVPPLPIAVNVAATVTLLAGIVNVRVLFEPFTSTSPLSALVTVML
jgi:hypothetical protein